MKLNLEKIKVMHLGKSNPNAFYCMTDDSVNQRYVEETNLKRDLSVLVTI